MPPRDTTSQAQHPRSILDLHFRGSPPQAPCQVSPDRQRRCCLQRILIHVRLHAAPDAPARADHSMTLLDFCGHSSGFQRAHQPIRDQAHKHSCAPALQGPVTGVGASVTASCLNLWPERLPLLQKLLLLRLQTFFLFLQQTPRPHGRKTP